MVNGFLILCILGFFAYMLWDQYVVPRTRGDTGLTVALKKRAKLDAFIFIALVGVIVFQSKGQVAPMTIFLLAIVVLQSLYFAFFRLPRLLFKQTGMLVDNIFVDYKKVKALNLTENNIFVIDLTNGKRMTAVLANPADKEQIFQFINGKTMPNQK